MSSGAVLRKVLVGIVDDGLAFAHERFRKPGAAGGPEASRVEFAWVQDGKWDPAKPDVPYGREITKATIDAHIAACTREGFIDEDEVYVRTGLFDYLRPFHKAATWRAAHGTHVMDRACGFDRADAVAIDRPIICVQLPAGATADTSGATLVPHALDAMQYILDRSVAAAQARRDLPYHVVINFSYGAIGGPHDGTSDLELAINDKADRHRRTYGVKVEVVLPAGNSHLSRCHAEIELPDNAPKVLDWRVLPDDWTDSVLDVWLPCGRPAKGRERLELTITAPNGATQTIKDEHGTGVTWGAGNDAYAEAGCVYLPPPTDRARIRLKLNPTFSHIRGAPTAPAGIWKIAFRNLAHAGPLTVQAWIQRDESLYGYPRRGRQSHFDDAAYERFDHKGFENEDDTGASPVKRDRLLNGIATGAVTALNGVKSQTIVVGGLLRKQDAPAKYTAAGPTSTASGAVNLNRMGPDALLPSDDSRVHRGILAAGTRSGAAAAMGGTSVAAPQVTRWIARRLAAGKYADALAVRDFAAAEDTRPNKPPGKRGGWGRINRPPRVALPRFDPD